MPTLKSVPAYTNPTAAAVLEAASLIPALPTASILERLAELQVEAELEGAQNALARALCTELETRLPEVTAGLGEFMWPDDELTASYIETLMIFAKAALDARACFLAAA